MSSIKSATDESASRAATVAGGTTISEEERRAGFGHRWGMSVDIDLCTGCQACVVACQTENNVAINEEQRVTEKRAKSWIRIERYWEGEFPNAKARYLPVLCQHCDNAPCEPVCPAWATYHNEEGLNVQVYNRCIGTRFCANGCPYSVRHFNFWNPEWPDSLENMLNPDVTVRTKGIIEKCTFCVQRINRARRDAAQSDTVVKDGDISPACVQACPTNSLVFGDLKDPFSKVSEAANSDRAYHLLEERGTGPAVVYLKKIDPNATSSSEEHHG